MGIELTNAGETLAAIVVSDEISKQASTNEDSATTCTNCGANLAGAYCHACGQSAHIHRSLLHMFEEVLHGIFHFDTKAWRTIPALIFKPGHLTKHYIQGKRTSFVSPLALFLFLIFLMFFVFSYTMDSSSNEMLSIPGSREHLVKELAEFKSTLSKQLAERAKQDPQSSDAANLLDEIYDNQFEIKRLQDALNEIDGKEKDIPTWTQELASAEKNLASLKELELAQQLAQKDAKTSDATTASPSNVEASSVAASSLNSATTSAATSALASAISGKELKPWELAQAIRAEEREVRYLKKQLAASNKAKEKSALKQDIKTALKADKKTQVIAGDASITSSAEKADSSSNVDSETNIANFKNMSNIPFVGESIEHATKNPELLLYKMKKNASGLAFLLMPITLPFLWLLFAFKRKYVMFDHAVFSLYSLSFMCILLTTVAILAKLGLTGTATFLFITVPPVHMYMQLKHAYSLGRFETLWRTMALLFIALTSLSVYATIVTMLSA